MKEFFLRPREGNLSKGRGNIAKEFGSIKDSDLRRRSAKKMSQEMKEGSCSSILGQEGGFRGRRLKDIWEPSLKIWKLLGVDLPLVLFP